MSDIPLAVLTDEEQEECQQAIRRLTQTDDGEWVVKEEYLETFQRGIIAHCLMGRAERFLELAGGSSVHITFHVPYYSPEQTLNAELVGRACKSAAKACAIYSLPIYFFDFGCILYQSGKIDEAKTSFKQFLLALEKTTLDPYAEGWQASRDMVSSRQIAKELTD